MRSIRAWFMRLGGLVGTARRERDLADELASHLQLTCPRDGPLGSIP